MAGVWNGKRYLGDATHELIVGTAAHETIFGGGGNDTILASGGNDLIRAGAGNDIVSGGAGRNAIGGGAGDDTIGVYLDEATDWVWGGSGNDLAIITVQTGDRLVAGVMQQEAFVVQSLAGHARLFGFERFHISGGEENDDIDSALNTNSTIDGAGGDDTVEAFGEFDLVFGGDGDDLLGGYDGSYTIHGGEGADFAAVLSSTGASIVHGDAGDDTVYVSMAAGDGSVSAYGGAGNDYIYSAHDTGGRSISLNGGNGNDTIWAAGWVDETALSGGDGADIFRVRAWDQKVPGAQTGEKLVISDFQAEDRLILENLGVTGPFAFVAGSDPTIPPFDNEVTLLYDTDNGLLTLYVFKLFFSELFVLNDGAAALLTEDQILVT